MIRLRSLLLAALVALGCLGSLVGCQPKDGGEAAPGTTEPAGGGY